MAPINNVSEVAQFLESLKAGGERPRLIEYMNTCLPDFSEKLKTDAYLEAVFYYLQMYYAKPSDLVEKVKACIRVGMDAERKARTFPSGHVDLVKSAIAQELRKLTEAE